MSNADLIRHIEKAEQALEWVLKRQTLENESNAALHLADKVFYSPLTTLVKDALDGLRQHALPSLREEQGPWQL